MAVDTAGRCVPEHQTLDILNVTTDVGLSPPFNSLFTIFGQFFDHGLDKITNGGNGSSRPAQGRRPARRPRPGPHRRTPDDDAARDEVATGRS